MARLPASSVARLRRACCFGCAPFPSCAEPLLVGLAPYTVSHNVATTSCMTPCSNRSGRLRWSSLWMEAWCKAVRQYVGAMEERSFCGCLSPQRGAEASAHQGPLPSSQVITERQTAIAAQYCEPQQNKAHLWRLRICWLGSTPTRPDQPVWAALGQARALSTKFGPQSIKCVWLLLPILGSRRPSSGWLRPHFGWLRPALRRFRTTSSNSLPVWTNLVWFRAT